MEMTKNKYCNKRLFQFSKNYLNIRKKKICIIRVFVSFAQIFLLYIYFTLINTFTTIINILINHNSFQY